MNDADVQGQGKPLACPRGDVFRRLVFSAGSAKPRVPRPVSSQCHGLGDALAQHALEMARVGFLLVAGDGLQVAAQDRKSTRLNSSHGAKSRMPSSA